MRVLADELHFLGWDTQGWLNSHMTLLNAEIIKEKRSEYVLYANPINQKKDIGD